MTNDEFQAAVLTRLGRIDDRLERIDEHLGRLESRLDLWISMFNAQMDALSLRWKEVRDGLTTIEERLRILEMMHAHHMADIDKRLAKLEGRS